MKLLAWIGICVITVLLALICSIAEYRATKKYYPDITFAEYLILKDKLRITPNGE